MMTTMMVMARRATGYGADGDNNGNNDGDDDGGGGRRQQGQAETKSVIKLEPCDVCDILTV
jgi:hypothetical protein